MKKSIICFCLWAIALSCYGQSKKLLGTCSVADLKREPFSAWYTPAMNDYQPNAEVTAKIQKLNLNKFTFKVFFGTWCGDSKRELPRMSKIFNTLAIPEKNIQWIALDDSSIVYKQSPQHEEKDMNVFRVPTFVVYEKGVEIGRINEFPVETLERDLQKILEHQPYDAQLPEFCGDKIVVEQRTLKRQECKCSWPGRSTSC